MRVSRSRLFAIILVLTLVMVQFAVRPTASAAPEVVFSPQKVIVDGREATVEAYSIDGYKYFKLRDIAQLLNGTGSQFSVAYDVDTLTVTARTGEAYQPVGGELSFGVDRSGSCAPSAWTLEVNGLDVGASMYLLGGNNFLRLRDLGVAFGFAVAYDKSGAAVITTGKYSLVFDPADYTVKTLTLGGQTITYRAYENVVYVSNPVDTHYQVLNFYVPEAYYRGESIGGYNAETAPIFFPNTVGGYMPGAPGAPGPDREGNPNAVFVALSKGYVVAAPGARGRTLQDESGRYTGKAPACIVDLKAAVRYLRYNDEIMPGDAERIISNGTSAGGALSSLLGATGNHPDYEPYLEAIGAADERDDIFAASCYCPITNLDNSDTAYEWQFNGVNDYAFGPRTGTLTEEQIKVSDALKALFPAYVNSLGLKKADGTVLTLDENGEGTFKEYVESFLIASAQEALDRGADLSGLACITIEDGKVTDVDFGGFVRYMGRMKPTPAFDSLDAATWENNLFGTATVDNQHFTEFAKENSKVGAPLADPAIVKMMNPMNYIGTEGATVARYWRIRHGALDKDTSFAIPVILATKLQNEGFEVDFKIPWGRGHGGDYDLDELFAWMERICH